MSNKIMKKQQIENKMKMNGLKEFFLMMFFILTIPFSFSIVATISKLGINLWTIILIFGVIAFYIGWVLALRIIKKELSCNIQKTW